MFTTSITCALPFAAYPTNFAHYVHTFHPWARSEARGGEAREASERAEEGRNGVYIFGIGGMVFSPKRPKSGSVNCVFMRFSVTVFFGVL